MKRLFAFFMVMMLTIASFAQVTLTQAQVDSLPETARIAIQASVAKAEAQRQLEAVSEYAGLGREIGEAVNGALTAVEDHVLSIADSDLGQTAIFIVCWKLLYKDIVGIVVGLLLLIGLTAWIIWVGKHARNKESTYQCWDDSTQEVYWFVQGFGWVVLFIASMICIFG